MDPFGVHEPKLEQFLPPVPFDPNNSNEYADLSEIFGPEMAKQEDRSVPVVIQGPRVRYFTTRTNAWTGTQCGNNGRNWVPRTRSGRVSKKETCSREERLIKGRIASREWHEKKKAQLLQMKAEMQQLREENALLKKNKDQSLQMEAEIQRLRAENKALNKLHLPQPGRQLQRTVSAPI